ncbi:MAG: tRNA (cytidine(34)-2'-O)-methyltransferase [Azoarcus sp.]|jgi:tRNA (cytidine/uridine-2'-O-)-methyltransferase|nr:tRNA (cytidine(34)-2'-O)-methyltransferase [Azoarcus sp.]
MFDIILHEPEIPPNTGNIIRLTANSGARLHLVEPLGFDLSDRQLRRAGLDYHDLAHLTVHRDWPSCHLHFTGRRMFALSTRGGVRYDRIAYAPGDVLLFGAETRGLPAAILEELPPSQRLCIPMRPGNRSINLSNAVALVVYEGWRQNGFKEGGDGQSADCAESL